MLTTGRPTSDVMRPFTASMGVYVFKREALLSLLHSNEVLLTSSIPAFQSLPFQNSMLDPTPPTGALGRNSANSIDLQGEKRAQGDGGGLRRANCGMEEGCS